MVTEKTIIMSKDLNKDFCLEILKDLVAFKSVTPKGLDALDYVANILKPHGFIVDIQIFGTGEEATGNLYAYKKLGYGRKNLCFAGHVDVVPPGDMSSWRSDPFKLHEEDNKLYGRGVVDMKGAIAAFIAASIDFIENDMLPEASLSSGDDNEDNGCISFLLTTDEEGSGKFGTKKMLEYISNTYQPIDFCLVGEPSSEKIIGDMIKIGRRGSISFELKIIGKQGHVAYPDLALNPIRIALKILNQLEEYKLDNGTKYFSPSNLEITSIDTGNPTSNVIPESILAKFNIRFNDKHDEINLAKLVENIIKQHTSDYELKYNCSSLPFIQKYSEDMQRFSKVIEDITGISPKVSTSGGTSDGRFIYKYAEMLEFGLKSNFAHKIDEYCEKCDLQMLQAVYYAYLVEFFKNC